MHRLLNMHKPRNALLFQRLKLSRDAAQTQQTEQVELIIYNMSKEIR